MRNLVVAVAVSILAACTSGGHRVTIGPDVDDGSLVPLIENPVDPRLSSDPGVATSGSVTVTASSVASSPGAPVGPVGPAPGSIIGGGGPGQPPPGTGTTAPPPSSTEPPDGTDPAEPTTTTRAARHQAVEITTPTDWRFPASATITVSATSGLTDFTVMTPAGGACAVEDPELLILRAIRAGTCTVTVVQPGDESWARAEASATVDIDKGMPVFTGDGDRTFEYRPAAIPYALMTTSTAGGVEHETASPLCSITDGALDIDLVSGSLPVLCEITATTAETDDYLAASTTFTVGVDAIRLAMLFGPLVLQPDGITVSVDAMTELPPDLGLLFPVFTAVVDDPVNCELVPPVPLVSAVGLGLSVVNRSGGPITCLLTASVTPDRYFSADGATTIEIAFDVAAEPSPV